jgi:hypothetical protein
MWLSGRALALQARGPDFDHLLLHFFFSIPFWDHGLSHFRIKSLSLLFVPFSLLTASPTFTPSLLSLSKDANQVMNLQLRERNVITLSLCHFQFRHEVTMPPLNMQIICFSENLESLKALAYSFPSSLISCFSSLL